MIKQEQYPGKLLVFEGIDGAGKTTLINTVADYCNSTGHTTLITREPGDSSLGKYLRELVQNPTIVRCASAEFLLFAADRAQHIHEVIIPALKEGKLILCDRFTDSSLVYQGYGRGLDIHMIRTINAWVTQHIEPDLIFYVRITPEIAQERLRAGRSALSSFEQETAAFTRRLIEGFDTLYAQKHNVCIIDGQQSKEIVAQQATTALQTML